MRQEWQGRLQAGLADAAADADRRLASEVDRARGETEKLSQAAAEAADRHRRRSNRPRGMERTAAASLADAAAETERRLAGEAERGRVEIESLTRRPLTPPTDIGRKSKRFAQSGRVGSRPALPMRRQMPSGA